MPTKQQIFNKSRKLKKLCTKNLIFKTPQKKGVCIKIFTLNPKKPNSAERKVAKVKLKNGKIVIGYIPGENHNLQQHSIVLIRNGKTKDLPGVKYKLIKGIFDFK